MSDQLSEVESTAAKNVGKKFASHATATWVEVQAPIHVLSFETPAHTVEFIEIDPDPAVDNLHERTIVQAIETIKEESDLHKIPSGVHPKTNQPTIRQSNRAEFPRYE